MSFKFRATLGSTMFTLVLASAAMATVANKNETPLGWASQSGGTTGGNGGTEVTVTNLADFQKYAAMSGKYVIWVSGTMGNAGDQKVANGGDVVKVASNKTILGLPGATLNGSLAIQNGVSNIIVRNLSCHGPGAWDVNGADAVHIEKTVQHVWVDHLDVADGQDGNMDITHACDYITASWVKFHYTNKSYPSLHPGNGNGNGGSHRLCNLIGHSDNNAAEDSLHLLITFYKTWWADGVAERMPRVRFGKVHVDNCLFTSQDSGQIYCVRVCHRANLVVENNAFIAQKLPIDTIFDPTFSSVVSRNNYTPNCVGNTSGSSRAAPFTPPYAALAFTDPTKLQAELSDPNNGAGANLTWGTTSIPAPGQEISYAPRLERVGTREILSNPAETPVTATVWSVTGRKLSQDIVLQPGGSADLPVQAGIRILKLVTAQGQESRVLPLK
jgi:pectate lyase